jgi:hypothetical protein
MLSIFRRFGRRLLDVQSSTTNAPRRSAIRRGGIEPLEQRLLLNAADDHGDNAGEATLIAANSVNSGVVEVAGDVDWFRFSASAGETFIFNVELVDLEDSLLQLIDRNGIDELESNDDVSGGNLGSQIAGWHAPADGDYYLVVSGFFPETGSYTLSVDVTPEDHGNDFASATPVLVGSLTDGVIEVPGDVDWFRFHAQQGQVFVLQTNTGSARLHLVDRNGTTQLRRDNDGGPGSPLRIEWQAPQAGTYFLNVSGSGSYRLSVEEVIDDHGNAAVTATSIVPNSITEGAIEIGQDVDWFSFQAVTGQLYVIRTELDSLDGSLLRLIDAGGNTVETNGRSNAASRIVWVAPNSATYSLEISSFDAGEFGSYRLTLDALTDDHADDAGGATPVADDSFVLGSIEFGGDTDWFRFQTFTEATYILSVTLDSLGDSVLRLMDPSGQGVLEFDDAEGASRIVWVAPTADTYYLEVSAFDDEIGDYRVDVTLVDDDHGNSSATATPLAAGVRTEGEVEVGGDVDWFSFSAHDGEVYVFQSISDTLSRSHLRLIPPSGNESNALASDSGSGPGGSSRIEWIAPADGTYFLIVRGFGEDTGSYAIEASLIIDDHGDDHQNATPVNAEAVTGGEIEVRGDVDWFRFSPQTGRDYLVEVDPDTLPRVKLSLFDADGSPLLDQDTAAPGQSAIVAFRAVSASERFIQVAGHVTSNIGTYGVSVTQVPDDHGDTFGTSTDIEIPDPATNGVMGSGADVDWFRFDTEGGQEYVLETTLLELNGARMRLLDTDGTTLLRTDEGSGRIIWSAPQAGGRFFVEISAASDTDYGSYQFDIRPEGDDHGDNDVTATPVGRDSSTAGEITEGDTDWFSFQANEGDLFDFEVHLGTLPDSVLRLIDVDGVSELIEDDDGGLDTASRIADWTAPTTGRFFLEVRGFDSLFDAGSYVLDVSSEAVVTLVGDLTGNGFVDFADLTLLLASWNKATNAASGNLVDPTGSVVNFADLTVLLAAWTGSGPGGSPVGGQMSVGQPTPSISAPTPELADEVLGRFASTATRRGHIAQRSVRAGDRGSPLRRDEAARRRLQAIAVDQAMIESTDAFSSASSRSRSIAHRRNGTARPAI